MEEIWKPITGYDGKYEVSNLGRIKSFYRNRIRVMSLKEDAYGYNYIVLSMVIRGKRNLKYKRIHRLVATAFIENKYNKPCVNHIDNNPKNNVLSNLEWVTYRENTHHSMNQNRFNKGETNGTSKLKNKDVSFIKKSNLKADALASLFNVSISNIYYIKRNKTWVHIL